MPSSISAGLKMARHTITKNLTIFKGATLDVQSGSKIIIRGQAGAPSTVGRVKGELSYNTTTNKLLQFNGTAWEAITSA